MIDEIQKISGKDDFIRFLSLLAQDFQKHGEQWANHTVPEYLEQIASWMHDFSASPANDVNWSRLDFQLLARIFYMGKLYE